MGETLQIGSSQMNNKFSRVKGRRPVFARSYPSWESFIDSDWEKSCYDILLKETLTRESCGEGI